jgi:hypothetical protein
LFAHVGRRARLDGGAPGELADGGALEGQKQSADLNNWLSASSLDAGRLRLRNRAGNVLSPIHQGRFPGERFDLLNRLPSVPQQRYLPFSQFQYLPALAALGAHADQFRRAQILLYGPKTLVADL